VFEHLRLRGVPGVFAFAVPNGGVAQSLPSAFATCVASTNKLLAQMNKSPDGV
jgi:hypothetical protein